MSSTIRRVVTETDASGRAVIGHDEQVPSLSLPSNPGVGFIELWRTAQSPVAIDSPVAPPPGQLRLAPGPMGTVLRIVDAPPDKALAPPADAAAFFAGLGASGAIAHDGPRPHPMMHRTETLDYGIVLEGEIYLVLDDSETLLKPGDVVIQRGTNHAWSNRSEKVCRMAFILLDGSFGATPT